MDSRLALQVAERGVRDVSVIQIDHERVLSGLGRGHRDANRAPARPQRLQQVDDAHDSEIAARNGS